MNLNCKKIAEKKILNKNPFYAFNLPIGLLVAIIVFCFVTNHKLSKNSYVIQIIIPVLTFLLTIFIIDVISRNMITDEDKEEISLLCNSFENYSVQKPNSDNFLNHLDVENFTDDDNSENVMDDDNVENFTDDDNTENVMDDDNVENFTNDDNTENVMDDDNVENFTDDDNAENVMDDDNVENFMTVSEEMELNDYQSNNLENIDFTSLNPFPLEVNKKQIGNMCQEPSNNCNLCSGSKDKDNLISPIPGPQWMPQNAEYVQNRLKNNNYTKSKCNFKN